MNPTEQTDEQLIAEARRMREQLRPTPKNLWDSPRVLSMLTDLANRLEAARRDSERLDFLQSVMDRGGVEAFLNEDGATVLDVVYERHVACDLCEAIDEARTKGEA